MASTRSCSLLLCALLTLFIAASIVDALSQKQPTVIKKKTGVMTPKQVKKVKKNVQKQVEPWTGGYKELANNTLAQTCYTPTPAETVARGPGTTNNYTTMANDASAAYQNALRYTVTGDTVYADSACKILDAWRSSLKSISLQSADGYLVAGIQGFVFSMAGQLVIDYENWSGAAEFKTWLTTVFYPPCHDFLLNHHGNGPNDTSFWAHYDMAAVSGIMGIGICTENGSMYDEAVEYFMHGGGQGSLDNWVVNVTPDPTCSTCAGLGQVQEAGYDQTNATLSVALAGQICQCAWNQGTDLFGYKDNLVLKASEYTARYNLNQDVPFTPYSNQNGNFNSISANGRGCVRPAWEIPYNHYCVNKGMKSPSIEQFAQKVRPEGGCGDHAYGAPGSSQQTDQLGFGTLTCSQKKSDD